MNFKAKTAVWAPGLQPCSSHATSHCLGFPSSSSPPTHPTLQASQTIQAASHSARLRCTASKKLLLGRPVRSAEVKAKPDLCASWPRTCNLTEQAVVFGVTFMEGAFPNSEYCDCFGAGFIQNRRQQEQIKALVVEMVPTPVFSPKNKLIVTQRWYPSILFYLTVLGSANGKRFGWV